MFKKQAKEEVVEASETTPEVEAVPEVEYVHTAGTVHLNAYYADVEVAKAALNVAKGNLAAAEQRLANKLGESNGN